MKLIKCLKRSYERCSFDCSLVWTVFQMQYSAERWDVKRGLKEEDEEEE